MISDFSSDQHNNCPETGTIRQQYFQALKDIKKTEKIEYPGMHPGLI
jgi:hypothetical protein